MAIASAPGGPQAVDEDLEVEVLDAALRALGAVDGWRVGELEDQAGSDHGGRPGCDLVLGQPGQQRGVGLGEGLGLEGRDLRTEVGVRRRERIGVRGPLAHLVQQQLA